MQVLLLTSWIPPGQPGEYSAYSAAFKCRSTPGIADRATGLELMDPVQGTGDVPCTLYPASTHASFSALTQGVTFSRGRGCAKLALFRIFLWRRHSWLPRRHSCRRIALIENQTRGENQSQNYHSK